jgi:hypothetical protein
MSRARHRHAASYVLLLAVLLWSGRLSADEPDEPVQAPADPQVEAVADNDSTETGEAAEPVAEEPAYDPCAPTGERGEAWIDWLHEKVYTTVCGSATWFDSFFGSERIDDEQDFSHGRLALHLVWSEYDRLDYRGQFRAHINFPNLDNRVHAFLGRVDEDEYVADTGDSINDPFIGFRDTPTNDWLVGLGYSPLRGSPNRRLKFAAGVKLGFPPEPYVKTQYRYYHFFDEDRLLRFRQTVFWRSEERLGTTTNIDFEQRINHRFLLRWANTGTLTQETTGVEWWTNVTLYQDLAGGRAMAYKVWWTGETDAPVTVEEYGFRVTYRQQVWREWLFGEVETGLSWPREHRHEAREASFGVGIGFEMKFGFWPQGR